MQKKLKNNLKKSVQHGFQFRSELRGVLFNLHYSHM
jgi:hypothetical protein